MAEKLVHEKDTWFVENFKGKDNLEINPETNKDKIKLFKVDDSIVKISGKVTNITVNNCNRVGILFADVIASVEVANSKKINLQATGSIPNIQLDNVNGATIYLTNDNKAGVEIITCSATEINVVVAGATENDDPAEHPIPQQYISKFVGSKLVTGPTEHVGV